jgi:DNA-binding winged helix-turn-helix (wHTH) protein
MKDVPGQLEGIYEFGPFQLDPLSRTLTRDGVRVPLAPRLFDTLFHLVVNNGRLVPREELMRAVWPARTVEETSLGMAVSSLRTAMKQQGAADNLIITAPGRGYRFGARVTFRPASAPAADIAPAASPPAAQSPAAPAAVWRHCWRPGLRCAIAWPGMSRRRMPRQRLLPSRRRRIPLPCCRSPT